MICREDVEIESGKITVTVKLKKYCNRDNKKIITCKTKNVEAALTEMGIDYGRCLESSDLSNLYPQHSHGVWIFEQKVKQRSTRKRDHSRSEKKNTEKVEKTLDKSGEYVIMIEKNKMDNLLSEED